MLFMEEMKNVMVEEVVEEVTKSNPKVALIGLGVAALAATIGVVAYKKIKAKKEEDDGVIVGKCREVDDDEAQEETK